MTETVQLLSGITSLVCAALISVVVLGRRVHEGPVIKFGLILMTVGLLGSGVISLKGFDTMQGLWNSSLLLRSGLLIALVGYAWRVNFYNLKGEL